MTRDTLRLFGCAVLLLAGATLILAGQDTDKIANALLIQKALAQGRDALKCGRYREAVEILEGPGELIDGNRDYLKVLRDAYLGLLGELQEKKQSEEAAHYRRRLAAVDPGAFLELKTPGPGSNPPPAPPPTTERTQVQPEIDPFSDANSVRIATAPSPTVTSQTQALLEQAEAAFKAGKYNAACRLYEQVATTDANAIAPAKERWAYCKLHGVVAQLNQAEPAVQAIPPQVLEREVRLALSMAPKLEPYGQKLLRDIQERQRTLPSDPAEQPEDPNAGQVRHLEKQERGWSVAETTNFRILHLQAPDLAERVAKTAEAARVASSRKWFGDVPPSWVPRCDVYLYLTRQDYSKATGQPSDCPGHSTLSTEGERVLSRRIDLHVDDPNMILGVLPHETTHVVLAGRFGSQALPRWADEGMAVLSEPRDRVERHLRNLPQHQRDRQLFAVADLMQWKDYPEGKYIGAFYAQSVSLVDYLCQIKGTEAFTRFLRDGMTGGYEPALRKHYGVQTFAELQQRWQAATLTSGNPLALRKQ